MTDSLFPTPGSVKTLRAYYKDRLAVPDPDDLHYEMFGEHDRARIILMSAMLEDALVLRITESLKIEIMGDNLDFIFRFEGPLGTFSARTEIAYVFGAITKSTAEQLNLFREMRNACAHSKFKLSFEAPELANVAKRLFRPLGVMRPLGEDAEGLRKAFYVEFLVIYFTLLEGTRQKAVKHLIESWSQKDELPPLRDILPQQ